VWRRRREAASAGFSAAALYSVYSGLYSEVVVSSIASAVALAEVGRFGEAVQYVQRAAEALYEAAKDVFEHVKITVQRLVELFVEAVARVLAWVDEHKAYLFLMAAVSAGIMALSVALDMWGLVELEKLAHAAVGAPFVAGLADAGGKAAERFRAVAERYERWKIEEKVISEIINAPLNKEKPFSKLTSLENLPPPLVELREALKRAEDKAKIDEVEKDAAVVAALVLYKTLVKNAEAYREWAGWYEWARRLVEEQEFAVAAEEVKRLREAQKRLEEVAEQVRRELNAVLALYALHSRELYEKLRPHLEVDFGLAEELAEARHGELSKYSNANIGTKAYAALLSIARGGIYGHAATLFMVEGALADVLLLTPKSAYEKAWKIAKGRGEAVDPSRVGAAGWEDRAASALLRYLLSRAIDEDLVFRRVEGGFEVFRTYGGVEARVDVLKIEGQPRSKPGEEVLRLFVEEARRTAPDLSGVKKIWQTLEWFATDVSFAGRQVVGGTVRLWQLRWYIALFGEGGTSGSGASITEEGIKLIATMLWSRERLDHIIAEAGEELKPLLGRAVRSWRELVDAIDWSWVLERVRELADALKPWIGRKDASDEEREELVRRMLGELALLVRFVETRRGMDDSRWREERSRRLAKAVEALSGGRIASDDAKELAKLIISYAGRRDERTKKRIDKLAEELVGVSKEEVWSVVERVLSGEDPYVYCLVRDCTDDRIVRKFVAPALELIMLDKALNNKFDREEARLRFGEMCATAVAGDGTVGRRLVELAVGGELGGGAALLRLATLHLHNQLLPDELKFNVWIYVKRGRYYYIAAYGEDATRFMRLLAVSAPSAGGEYLSEKFDEFMKEARVEVQVDNIRLTEGGNVAAALIISEAGVAVKYNVYLRNMVELRFQSADRYRVELAARLLKLAGVNAEVKKREDSDVWYVYVYTDSLAAGRKEFRDAIVKIVEAARDNDWIDAEKAERWLEKLKKGLTLIEGWPKYEVGLAKGALMIRFSSTNPDSIERERQRLKKMGLVEGKHFTVKMPEEGRDGYVSVLKEGLAYAARLSVRGKGERQRMAAKFVNYILQRAEWEGDDVHEKVREIIKEGKAWGSPSLEGFVKEVEVNGRRYVVKVLGGGAEFGKGRGGKKLLRLKITAEVGRVEGEHIVDRVVSEYTITYGKYEDDNKTRGFAYASANVPGGREADAERLSALVKALTGKEPWIQRMKDGRIMMACGREHLDGFRRYAELADAIENWLERSD
jgi:PaRep2b protein.